jgi:hypothetical protein
MPSSPATSAESLKSQRELTISTGRKFPCIENSVHGSGSHACQESGLTFTPELSLLQMAPTESRNILFFDTETTGLQRPDLVEICWMVYQGRRRLHVHHYLIRPDGWIVPVAATNIHGISHERAVREGRPLREVMQLFIEDIRNCQLVVAHNLHFDRRVMHWVAQQRLEMDANAVSAFWHTRLQEFCTCRGARHQDAGRQRRAPSYKLGELYQAEFGEPLMNAHSADADVDALQRLFWARFGQLEDNRELPLQNVRQPRRAAMLPPVPVPAQGAVGALLRAFGDMNLRNGDGERVTIVLVSPRPANTVCFHAEHGCGLLRNSERRTLMQAQETMGQGGQLLRPCRRCWPDGLPL